MGQQQLLLLVLGIVIVGLAVVVGIQAFDENRQRANLDALVNDGVRIASDVQTWSLKPAVFGGPSTGEDWTDATFTKIGYTAEADGTYETASGTFTLDGGTLTATGDAPRQRRHGRDHRHPARGRRDLGELGGHARRVGRRQTAPPPRSGPPRARAGWPAV